MGAGMSADVCRGFTLGFGIFQSLAHNFILETIVDRLIIVACHIVEDSIIPGFTGGDIGIE